MMPKLELVKGNTVTDQPRGRQPGAVSERRFRYPAEEIWEVSDDGWHTLETMPRPEKSVVTN